MSGNKAINDVFLTWRDHIARVVSRIVPPHDIEDIVQETYVRLCQFKSREDIRSPGALMTRIAHNLAVDHLKRAGNRLSTSIDEAVEAEIGQLSQYADEPYIQAASREEFGFFCEAVRTLPQQCRRVFVLKKVYGHTQKEIAKLMNLSENTVEKHIASGVKRCTLYMREQTGKDGIYGESHKERGTRSRVVR